ncbi:DNA cytosine methyltransferase [Nostoc sp.]|uniref:DNA cytosine methyltransferase n=1 Tax=Nostoc sp. TaxID=1180 RepID=UPI002FFC8930
MADSISTVDLFCGVGGLTYGFEQAGLPVRAGYDIDPACQFPYEHNTKAEFILEDVEHVNGSDLAEQYVKQSDILNLFWQVKHLKLIDFINAVNYLL